MGGQSFSSVELEIAWGQLIAIIDEAAAALVRTSFSTIVREARDYTVVLLDRAGRAVAQPTNSAPPFNGTMPRTMRHFIEKYPLEDWSPGDVVITNDPWMGTGHLNDANLARPIFLDGELIGFVGVVAHTVDIGGIIWSAGAREVFEEGLQIPTCRLFNAGEPNEDVINFIPPECPHAGYRGRRPAWHGRRRKGGGTSAGRVSFRVRGAPVGIARGRDHPAKRGGDARRDPQDTGGHVPPRDLPRRASRARSVSGPP